MTIIRNRTIRYAAASLLLAGAMAPAYAGQSERLANNGQTAAAKAPNAAPASARAERATPRRICVRMEMSGTRISREVCRTQAEWDRTGGLPDE
jgi:hypothetical protein